MVTRISGLSSGMDIDSIVAKLMKAERLPLDKLNRNKQILTWQTDDYRSMNSKLLEFRNQAFNMKLDSAFMAKKVTSSNESAVSVTGTPNATEGMYQLIINKLAKAGSVTSSSSVTPGATGDPSKKMSDLDAAFVDTTLTVYGEKGSSTILVKATDTLSQVMTNINGKSSFTGVKVSFDTNMNRMFFVSTSTGDAAKVNLKAASNTNMLTSVFKLAGVQSNYTAPPILAGTPLTGQTVTGSRIYTGGSTETAAGALTAKQTLVISYQGNNYEDVIDKSKSIGQIIDDINGSALGKTGVSAYLDANGRLAFLLPDKNATPAPNFTITNKTGNTADIVDILGLTTTSTTDAVYKTIQSVDNRNADITFNNVNSTNYATNTFSISGMTITAKSDNNGTGVTVNLTVNQDVDAVFNSIKSFVDKYNDTISSINSKIDEKRFRDFQPLSDEQKASMKDEDIKRWEEKAKSGLLHSDGLLSSALSKLRTSFSKTVTGLPSGALNQMSQIGITTGLYQERGKLYIDDAKLKDAIATKPAEVQKLFNAVDGDTTKDDGDGLAVRLYDQAKYVMDQITNKAGAKDTVWSKYTMGKTLNELDKSIASINLRLEQVQTRYYRQFSAMESAVNRMNAQSSYLSQQFATK